MKRRSLRRATTLVETMIAAGLTSMVLIGSVATFFMGAISWTNGQAHLDVETNSQKSVRMISGELRQAMAVAVDGDGNGLTYKLPSVDGTGNYIVPPVWDGVTRRIQLQNTNQIAIVTNGNGRVICRNVILKDPKSDGGNTAYKIFSPGTGAITRSITVMVVSQTTGFRNAITNSRSRETIFLRNIPELTR
jgi:hypothetical protein